MKSIYMLPVKYIYDEYISKTNGKDDEADGY